MSKLVRAVGLSLLMVCGGRALAQPTPICDQIVAQVEDEIITQQELNHAIKRTAEHAPSGWPSSAEDQRNMVLHMLINTKLQLLKAHELGLTVSQQELERALSKMAAARSITTQALRKTLTASGQTWAEVERNIRDELLIQKLRAQVIADRVTITPKAIAKMRKTLNAQAQGRQYNVIDVVFNQAGKDEQLAKAWVAKLRHTPKDQAHLLEDVQSTRLGWRGAASLPEVFLSTLKHAQPGDVLGPIKAPNGIHILIVQGVRGNTVDKISEEQVRHAVFNVEYQKSMSQWFKMLHDGAYIRIVK